MRLVVLSLLLAACANSATPTPTQSVCPTPDPGTSWESFGQQFMADYCTACHDSSLTHAQRNGAPLFHNYDTLTGVLDLPGHIDEYAGAGPAGENTEMPPGRCPSVMGGPLNRDCPQPTTEERTTLSLWLACEKARRAPSMASGALR